MERKEEARGGANNESRWEVPSSLRETHQLPAQASINHHGKEHNINCVKIRPSDVVLVYGYESVLIGCQVS
jgi:hypothetical protein